MGLGMFLQYLIQLEQLLPGWSPCLFLQTILSGDEHQYYLKCSYIHKTKNKIKSIPRVEGNPLLEKHAHVISDNLEGFMTSIITSF
jgi:hypothetical protein